MKEKRKLPPSVRKWGWRARYNGKLGTVFTSDRRDVSPYVFFADDDDRTAYPVQRQSFERLDQAGQADMDLLVLGGLIMVLILLIGGLIMDGTIHL